MHNKRGRPSGFEPSYVEQAKKLCKLGATDVDVADFFSVSVRTIYRWQAEFPEFCQALKVGKDEADNRVERSLYHRAVGYTHDAVKIFMPAGAKEAKVVPYVNHIPPDTTACIFWLKNRRAEEWRERVEHTGKDGGTIEMVDKANLARTIWNIINMAQGEDLSTIH